VIIPTHKIITIKCGLFVNIEDYFSDTLADFRQSCMTLLLIKPAY